MDELRDTQYNLPIGTDLISRQAAIDMITNHWSDFGNAYNYRTAKACVDAVPPIRHEIVRCKDCKYWIPYDWMFSEVWQSRNIADYPEDEIGCKYCDMSMKADDYCSRAERREVTE